MTWRETRIFGRPWQDLVFAAGEVVFLVALVPLMFAGTHVPTVTSLSTAAVLFMFSACQASYRNWFALVLTALAATFWLLLGIRVLP